MKVSVIATVKNEASNITSFLDSLLAQTKPPQEVIIVDGGSSDGTVEILHGYQSGLPLQILVRPGLNISQGRNMAIAAASGEIIASADAGVRLDREWLEEITRPFHQEGTQVDVVSGFFLPDPHSPFEVALAATTLPSLADIGRGEGLPGWLRHILLFTDPEKFMPSSRSLAFRKSAWAKVGGYPEWLDYSEDLVFDLALKRAGFRFYFQQRALVYFRPRPNLAAFFQQYFLYARGDGKARQWSGEHFLRYFSYSVFAPWLLILAILENPLWWIPFFLGAGVYLLGPYNRLLNMIDKLTPGEKIKAVLWVPIIRVMGDLAKMTGFLRGWQWRIAHRNIQQS